MSFSKLAGSVFFGGGGTLAKSTYTCKYNGKKCTAITLCFGGGPIVAVGLGIDFGGILGANRGIVDIYCPSELKNFSYGLYVNAGPVSQTHTGTHSNAGISKSWGGGFAFVTCTNFFVNCEK
jgi:hypothetical protein